MMQYAVTEELTVQSTVHFKYLKTEISKLIFCETKT